MKSESNQYDIDQERYIELMNKFTGISKDTLNEYLKDHSVQFIFEHPDSIDITPTQREKVDDLMELRGLYKNLRSDDERYVFNTPEKVGSYFSNYYNEKKEKEYVGVAYLDTKLQVISTEIISEGTINFAIMSSRDIAKGALRNDAKAVAIAHNHPSGNPKPSNEDLEVTYNIKSGLETLGIDLIDHVVVGENGKYLSFKRENLLEEYASLKQNGLLRESEKPYKEEKGINKHNNFKRQIAFARQIER